MSPFIVFEGIDGCGKSTQMNLLAKELRARGKNVKLLREPTSGYWGRKIRKLEKITRNPVKEKELEFFLRDRRWNVEKNILPALQQNLTILQDRYYYSTACYQSRNKAEFEKILAINCQFAPQPDLTLLIFVEVEEALRRIKLRHTTQSYFEKRDFLNEVQRRYKWLKGLSEIVLIDGNQSVDTTFAQIIQIYDRKFSL